jgi:L-asparaginase II
MVKSAVAEYCEYPEGKMTVGVDGCSAPNFSLPLQNLAIGFRKLTSAAGESENMKKSLTRIRQAMWEYPEMVSGEGRFDLELARSFPNNCICKVGAEAVEAIGFADPPIGIVVKIHDGSWRALWVVCVAVLKQLGLARKLDEYPQLARHEEPVVRNYRGLETGTIRCEFSLHSA